MNQLYIKNVSGGVFKIPFKLDTPYEVKKKVSGTIPSGKGILVPALVVPHIDMARLEYHKSVREIKVTVKKVRVPKVGIKPRKTSLKQVQKPKPKLEGKVQINKKSKGVK